eukprot:TRINITY_DN784_c0_g2_i1.p2 TRINITY_DN784_c0_g2~~TRINITY_DN784_c0_g2_i1.p2  ORF type:complete len:119 (-),score=26.82 TRINITY_DN784_c0_g2_i1:121-477(-)
MVGEVLSQQAMVVAEPVKTAAVAEPNKPPIAAEPVKPAKRAAPETTDEGASPTKKMRVHGPIGRLLGSVANWFVSKLSDGVSVAGKQSCPTISDGAQGTEEDGSRSEDEDEESEVAEK